MKEEIVSAAKDAVQEINPFKYLSKGKLDAVVKGVVTVCGLFIAAAAVKGGEFNLGLGENKKWLDLNMKLNGKKEAEDDTFSTIVNIDAEVIESDA